MWVKLRILQTNPVVNINAGPVHCTAKEVCRNLVNANISNRPM